MRVTFQRLVSSAFTQTSRPKTFHDMSVPKPANKKYSSTVKICSRAKTKLTTKDPLHQHPQN